MPIESENVDKRYTFSSLVSIYNHLYAMNDNSKTTLVCGTANCIWSLCLWGHKQTRSDISSYSTHSGGFPIVPPIIINTMMCASYSKSMVKALKAKDKQTSRPGAVQ